MAITGTLAPTAEEQALADQLEYARTLRQGALDTGGRMVGRHYIAKSPWENAIEGLVGGYMGASSFGKKAEIEALRKQQAMDFIRSRPSATTQETVEMQGPMPTGEAMAPVTQEVLKDPRQFAQENQNWAMRGLDIQHPLAQAAAQAGMAQAISAPEKDFERAEAAKIRKDEILAKAIEARTTREEADRRRKEEREEADKRAVESRKELVRLAASLRPPKDPQQPKTVETAQGVLQWTGSAWEPIKVGDQVALPKSTGATKKSAAEVKAGAAVDDMLDKITAAEQGLPYASGMGAIVPQGARQMYTSPQTKMADASISALGAEQAHALYGAAFTAAEQARAAQFLPVTTGITPDSTDTIKSKLNVLRVLTEKKKARLEGKPDPHPNMYNDILDPVGGAPAAPAAPAAGGKTVVREVQLKNGKIGVEYSDGTRGYK